MSAAPILDQLHRGTSHPLFPGLAIAGIGFSILAGAYAFEYLGGLKPCPLCLQQRVPWFVLIGLGGALAGAQAARAPKLVLIGLYAVCVLIALWSAYLGLFHAGVEYKWWPGPASCTGSGLPVDGGVLGPLSASDIVFCDRVPWALFGISMAGFNFLFSLVVAALAAWGGWRDRG